MRPGELAAQGPIVYITDDGHDAVRALDTRTGELRTVAGNGDPKVGAHETPRGDGGPATADRIDQPAGVAVDSEGRLYISDYLDDRVRRVDGSGVITTFAGGGTPPDGLGDGGQATDASIISPSSLAYDSSGNLFVVDSYFFRVRKISPSGIVTTIAGTTCGCTDPPHENVLATEATIHPRAVAVDASGHVHIADGNQVLKIDDAGMLRRVAGGGPFPNGLGDDGPAVDAMLSGPEALTFDAAGNLFIADSQNDRVRKVDTAGIITTVAGGGPVSADLGDGGPATAASLSKPEGVVVGPAGALYVSDTFHMRVRQVSDGIITTVAGNGTGRSGGDGGPAAKAQFDGPTGMIRDAMGNTYVADTGSHRVRKIDGSGLVTTVAGTGERGFSGDGGPASSARLLQPRSVALDSAGNLFVADTQNSRVRKVDTAGIITTVAGGGSADLGDGGPATAVAIEAPTAVAVDRAGNLYLTDRANGRVRQVTPAGTISTFAGGGTVSGGADIGDGGPATEAKLYLGDATLVFDALGQLHISSGGRVRKVDPQGVITTVAGGGFVGPGVYERVGRLATEVEIIEPGGIAFDASGSLFVVEGDSHRIMRIDAMGRMRFVAGTGDHSTGLGDGGHATDARIDVNRGSGLAFDDIGNLYLADTGAHRIRRIEAAEPNRVLSTGWNGVSQLGDGTTEDRRSAVAASGVSNVKTVSAGYTHTLAVKGDGTVWAWGWNALGQLGDGTTTDRGTAIRVPGLTDVVAVAGGAYHSLALRADGTVWAWGWNGLGMLGDGTGEDHHTPVPVAGLSGVKAIAAGAFHNLALANDGTVWAWGFNAFGQLGTGSGSQVETQPVRVSGSSGATSIAAGAWHSLSVRVVGDNYEVLSWGWNGVGQLGDGTTTDRHTPVRTPALAQRVFAGSYHSFAGGGTFTAWGYNNVGQLGSRSSAAVVLTPIDVVLPLQTDSIAGGLYHNVALAVDGSVMTWGWNGYGALGDGTNTMQVLPAIVPELAGSGVIAAGMAHSVVAR